MFGLPPLPRKLAAALTDAQNRRADVRLSALGDLVRLTRVEAERDAAVSGLEGLLAGDPSPELRAAAAMGLADAEASVSLPALARALDDGNARVRQMAVLAFGELADPGDRAGAARVEALLAAAEPPVRFQALIAFVRLCPERATPALLAASEDADDEIRAMAYRLAASTFDGDVEAPASLVARAERALGETSDAARAAAAIFLARRGLEKAEPVIVGVIDGSVRVAEEADRLRAIEVAAEQGIERARRALVQRAFGPFRRRFGALSWHALVAAASLGDERARHAILRDLAAWTRETRTLAVVAAGRAGLHEALGAIQGFVGNPSRADPEAVNEALRALGHRGATDAG